MHWIFPLWTSVLLRPVLWFGYYFFVSVNNQHLCFFCCFTYRVFFYSAWVLCLHPVFLLCSVVAHTAFSNKYHDNIPHPLLAEQKAAGTMLGVGYELLKGCLMCLCYSAGPACPSTETLTWACPSVQPQVFRILVGIKLSLSTFFEGNFWKSL